MRIHRRVQRDMSNPGNETFGRFQEVDSFEVEPVPDEERSSDVQHDIRIGFGIVHLFRVLSDDVTDEAVQAEQAEPAGDNEEDPIGTILCMLSVPSSITVSSLLDFIEPALQAIQNIRIVRYVSNSYRHVDQENNMVLFKFRDTVDAEEFYKMYNGRPFQALDVRPKLDAAIYYLQTGVCDRCNRCTELFSSPLLSLAFPVRALANHNNQRGGVRSVLEETIAV